MRAAAVGAVAVATLALAAPATAYYALTSTPAEVRHPVATLAAPQGLTAVGQAGGVVDLAWTAPAGPPATSWTVLRAGTEVCRTSTTTCHDTGLAPGSTVGYEVRAHLGTWTSLPATATATVPLDPRLTATAPAVVVAGTPFAVTLTADAAAAGSRTLSVSGPSTAVAPVSVTFTAQPDGTATGTASVVLTTVETTTLTFTDGTRTATTGPVDVGRAGGGLQWSDCQGPAGYSCGSGTKLEGATMSAVLTRAAADAAGTPLALPAATVTVTLKNDRKGTLDTRTVTFAAGATTSDRFSFTPDPGDNGRVQVTATALPDQPAPAPLAVAL